jgi:hypothetical protein
MRLLSVLSGLLLGACSVIGVRDGTEEPRFEVIDRVGAVEVRRYGPRLAAETLVASASETAARSEGFQRLAGYIFGGNQASAKIAMTAPVAQASERIAMTAPVGAAAAGDGRWTTGINEVAGYTATTGGSAVVSKAIAAQAPTAQTVRLAAGALNGIAS